MNLDIVEKKDLQPIVEHLVLIERGVKDALTKAPEVMTLRQL